MIRIDKRPFYMGYGYSYDLTLSIRPVKDDMKYIRNLFPSSYRHILSADFDPKSINGHSSGRWSCLLADAVKVAKFLTTYYQNPSFFKDYVVREETSLLKGNHKYSISFDNNYNNNGKKGLFVIKTGWNPSNIIQELEGLIRKMVNEIGVDESSKHADYYSPWTDKE